MRQTRASWRLGFFVFGSLLAALLASTPVYGQLDMRAETFTLRTGPCKFRSGTGSPEGAVTGNVCDTYIQTNGSTVAIWSKVSGSATNTGWQNLPGLGLANTWTGTTEQGGSFPAGSRYAALFDYDGDHDVWIRFHTGATARQRYYLAWMNYQDTSWEWLIGRNADNYWITYDATQGLHRLYMPSGGLTDIGSGGAEAVRINSNPNADSGSVGTGGLLVYSGGAYPSTLWHSLNASGITSAVGVTSAPYFAATDTAGTSTFKMGSFMSPNGTEKALRVSQAAVGSWDLGVTSGDAFALWDQSIATPYFSVATGGAATFSSTVAVGGDRVTLTGAGIAAPATTTPKLFNLTGVGPTLEGTAIQFRTGASDPVSRWSISNAGHLLPSYHWVSDIATDTVRGRTIYMAELNVWQLIARTVVSTIGGEFWTAPTTKLTADLGSGGDTITVNDNFLASGDRIVLKSLTNVEWMAVTSGAGGGVGAYTYDVTRNLDGTGADNWLVGQAVVSTGTTGDGMISQYAESSAALSGAVGPATAYIVRTGTTWSNLEERTVVGSLTGAFGYTSTSCSGSLSCYGLATGIPGAARFLVDQTNGIRMYDAGGNLRVSLLASEAAFRLYGTTGGNPQIVLDSTNGIRITNSAGTAVTQIDMSGNAYYSGTVGAQNFKVAATGYLASTGATAYGTGVGFWLGYDTSAYKFRIGDPAGQKLQWDGSSLSLTGTLYASAGYFGDSTNDVSIDASGLTVGNTGRIQGGATAYATGTGFWMGYDTSAYKFRIGNPAGNRLQWDGSALGVYGTLYTDYIEISTTNGIAFSAGGNDAARGLNWSDGSRIISRTDISSLVIEGGAGSQINMYAGYMKMWGGSASGDYGVYLDGDIFAPNASGSIDLGSLALPWGEVWLSGSLRPTAGNTLGTSTYRWSAIYIDPGSTTSADYPVVYSSSNHTFYYKSDGVNNAAPCSGAGVADVAVEYGVLTGVSCTSPEQSPLMRLVALEAEVVSLRQLVLGLSVQLEGRR